MGKFATGVTVLTYRGETETYGMTANAFMSLSIDPPMILIAARQQSRFAAMVRRGDRFGVSFLSEDQQHLSAHFGGRPNAAVSCDYQDLAGTPVLRMALVQMAVRADAIHDGGDHKIYIAVVEEMDEPGRGRPLVFYSGSYKQLHVLDPLHCWHDYSEI